MEPCRTFPIIVLTSNGERDLPLAFNRRCLRLEIEEPTPEELIRIVDAHLGTMLQEKNVGKDKLEALIKRFDELRREGNIMATDQLLNLVYLLFTGDTPPGDADRAELQKLLFLGLNQQ